MLDSLDTLSLWSDIYWFKSFQNYLELFQSTPLFVLFIYLFIYSFIYLFIYLFIYFCKDSDRGFKILPYKSQGYSNIYSSPKLN